MSTEDSPMRPREVDRVGLQKRVPGKNDLVSLCDLSDLCVENLRRASQRFFKDQFMRPRGAKEFSKIDASQELAAHSRRQF